MTVNLASNKIVYQGNGSNTSFSFSFSTPNANSIVVITEDQLGNITTQSPGSYSIVLNPLVGANPTPVGGIVTFPLSGPPLPTGSQIAIIRELSVVQPVSLSNQSIIYPPVIEQEFDYLTMIDQQDEETTNRAFTASVTDPVPAPVPPVAMRANQAAFFDANGNLGPGLPPAGGVMISAAMQPVVSALTLPQARTAMGIRSSKTISGSYGISSADNGIYFSMTGNAFYTISLAPATGFPADFVTMLINNDTRGKNITIDGYATFILWPTQSVIISQNGTTTGWVFVRSGRWRSVSNPVVFNVDFVNGSDSDDGLGTTTQAFKTLQHAVTILENECDGLFSISLANGTHNVGAGVICTKPILGSNGYNIIGNTSSPSSVTLSATSGNVINVTGNAMVTIQGVTVTNSNGSCIGSQYGGVVNLSSIVFGPAPGGTHMSCINGGIMNVTGTYTILSGANTNYHLLSQANAFVNYAPTAVTIGGAVTFSLFVFAQWSATIWAGPSIPFTGGANVTGGKYQAGYNGGINSNGTQFPGSVAGSTNNGGQFS